MNLVALARLDCVLSGRLIDHYGYQAVKAEAEFDSWLTVGITEGNTRNELSSIGISFETWCAQPAQRSAAKCVVVCCAYVQLCVRAASRSSKAQLYSDNGAVFWTDPDRAPPFKDQPKGTPVGRLTVKTGSGVKAVVNAQGRSTRAGADWEQTNIRFKL